MTATEQTAKPATTRYLSTVALGFTTAAAIVTSLRGLPAMAKEELTMFFYIAFSVVLFLIPAGLVAAELGSAFGRQAGGLYAWISGAFGKRVGFWAIFLSWLQAMVFYPTGLSFAAAGVAFAIDKPHLAQDHIYVGIFSVVAYWACTAVALVGNQFAAKVTQAGFLLGTAVPGLILVALFVWWLASGHSIGWEHTTDPAVTVEHDGHDAPRYMPYIAGLSALAFLGNILENFTGVESQAVHATELRNPGRQYPIAIMIAAVASAAIFTLGALAVAGILPYDRINLNSGVFDALRSGFDSLMHVGWPVLILAAMIAYGALAGTLAWITGPSRGVLATAHDGMLPPVLQKVNPRGVQVNILLTQGVVVTLLCLPYFLMSDVSSAFFLITAMAVGIYIIIYLFMYAAAIRLRYTRPDLPRSFKVPGGPAGMWIIAGIGFAAMAFALVTAFVPPSQLPIGNPATYVILVAGGTVLFCVIPLVVERLKKPGWAAPDEEKVKSHGPSSELRQRLQR
ncbi:amino acid permease [Nocardia mexicana]|uniref:Amino acid/polyamine/organocation transporter (APC superfamily) n=1 Tax=Nocardia mexicana TaxID=279262 RepID=A0A370GVK0_9NOCA|nr:amino acid permease [Nocardia mexicana]RDI47290.1 amino acid/polyamine/organocation transporter (APC superfamily) [Nocardia mexicana]